MTETFTLEQVLDGETFIITDGNPIPGTLGDWYQNVVYPADSFAKLNHDVLIRLVEQDLPRTLNWFSSPNVHVIPKNIDELERFARIISEKLSYLNEYEKGAKKSRTKSKRIKIDNPERTSGKLIMGEIALTYHNLLRDAKRQVYVPENEELFRKVSELVDVVADNTNSIKDFSMRYGNDKAARKSEDLHADEQIVAAAVYRSVIGEVTATVSPDSDIPRLLDNIVRLTTNSEMPNHEQFYELFNKHPIFPYFVMKSGDLEPGSNTDHLKEFKYFKIDKLSGVRLVRTKQRLEELSREILSLASAVSTQ